MTNLPQTAIDESEAGAGFAPAERVRALNDELRKTGAGGNPKVLDGKSADVVTTLDRAEKLFTDLNALL